MDRQSRYKAEIDWRELLEQPWRLFGYSYIYLVVSLVAVGWFYLGQVTTAGKNSIDPGVVPDSSALVTDVPLQTPRVLPPVDVMKVGVPSPELVAKGRDLYRAHCATCHGESGAGDGPAGIVLNPKPRDFRTLSGWTNGSKVSQIYRTLEEGIVRNGMASYSYMPPLDRFALVHFMRTLASGQPIDSEDELKALDEIYALSKGVNVSGQIPVKRALDIIVRESEPNVNLVSDAVRSNANDVFRRVATDPVRAMTTLIALRRRSASVGDVIRIVSEDPVQAGFKAEVSRLSAAEWSMLYQAAPSAR